MRGELTPALAVHAFDQQPQHEAELGDETKDLQVGGQRARQRG